MQFSVSKRNFEEKNKETKTNLMSCRVYKRGEKKKMKTMKRSIGKNVSQNQKYVKHC